MQTRKDFSIALILQEQFFTSELFKIIQDAILLILLLQDTVEILDGFFKSYFMSDVQLIYIPSSIQDWCWKVKILSNRQTVFFLPVGPMDQEHKDLDTIDLNAPQLAQYNHIAWMKPQNTVYWVDINLVQKKGLKFYQTRSNAIVLYETLPACCIQKVDRMEIGELIYEKSHASPRPPQKISLKHDWKKELGSLPTNPTKSKS